MDTKLRKGNSKIERYITKHKKELNQSMNNKRVKISNVDLWRHLSKYKAEQRRRKPEEKL